MMCNYSSFLSGNTVGWNHADTRVAYADCSTTTKKCKLAVLNPTKYKFMVDDHSTSLTIINLTTLDNGKYTCNVFTTNEISSSVTTLEVLNPVPPYEMTIAESQNQDNSYQDNSTVVMIAGERRNITCTVRGSRPPALIEWDTDVEGIQIMDQINVVEGQSYVSRRVATITPSKDDHNKLLRCLASHRELTDALQKAIHLYIQVLPRELQLTSSVAITNQTGTETLVVFENVPVSITCRYLGSRPRVSLFWELGATLLSGGITSSGNQNSMDNTLSDGESTLRISLKIKDHFNFVRCSTHAGQRQLYEQMRLVVNGPPDPPEILNTTGLLDGIATSVTCVSNNGYPAPVFQWNLGTTDLTKESRKEEDTNGNHRVLARSVLMFTPKKEDHGRYLTCQVYHPETPGGWSRSIQNIINVTYPPTIVDLSVRRTSDGDGNIALLFSCRVDARPRANTILWFFNGSNLENASNVGINQLDQHGSELFRTSTLRITNPQGFNDGKYECVTKTSLGNDSDAIIFSFSIPDPPSWLFIDQNQTTSSTLFVAWQPGFDGGFQQTFNLEYCPNNTHRMVKECAVVTNLPGTSYRLDGLNPFTWYQLSLWAENSAGNSSTLTTVASTAPLKPENYGVSVTRGKEGKVLKLSQANNKWLDEVCFVRTASLESCPLVNESQCIELGKDIHIDPGDEVVVVTYGRGLCSEPANITDQSGLKNPPNKPNNYMTIALGVIASVGLIILISLGLMCFYGVMCCTKRKKAKNYGQQEGRTVDDDELVYISVAHNRTHPPNAPPIQTEEPTLYASLNQDAMEHRKGEMKYSDTKATTPDGHPMYGNYLVKQRKQEQARMPPPVQTDDTSNKTEGSRRGTEGDIGPTMPDGQPMYGNYLIKMRNEQEKAEQMAGTYNFFEMYSI